MYDFPLAVLDAGWKMICAEDRDLFNSIWACMVQDCLDPGEHLMRRQDGIGAVRADLCVAILKRCGHLRRRGSRVKGFSDLHLIHRG